MKKFLFKVSDLNGNTLGVLNPQKIASPVSFNEKINGGQGECSFKYIQPFDDFDETLIAHMNVVRIYAIDEDNPLGRLIYTGFISEFAPFVQKSNQGVEITLLGLVSLLNFSYYKNGSSFTVTHSSQDPAVIFKAIIDHFNTQYPAGLITYDDPTATIDTVGTTITYQFEDSKWLDALNAIYNYSDADWWWRLDANGNVYLKAKPVTSTHIFTIGKDVDEVFAYSNNEKIVNDLQYRDGVGGTTNFSDGTSQTAYGKRSEVFTASGTTDATTIAQYGDKVIAEEKDPVKSVKATINKNYDLESIRVGDTCRFQNFRIGATVLEDNMQIVSLSYTPDKVVIQLEKDITVQKELEALARRATGQ